MSKIDHSLFNADEHALHHAYGECPDCHAKLQVRHGRSGLFLGCSQYPNCHFAKPLHEHENAEIKVIEGSECPACQSLMAVKKGRYGLFIGCTNFPECHYIEKMNEDEDKGDEQRLVNCPSCERGQLHHKINRYGKAFYACDHYPSCRYVVNQPPVEHACPECGWPLMVEKDMAEGRILQCPQKQCRAKLPLDE